MHTKKFKLAAIYEKGLYSDTRCSDDTQLANPNKCDNAVNQLENDTKTCNWKLPLNDLSLLA